MSNSLCNIHGRLWCKLICVVCTYSSFSLTVAIPFKSLDMCGATLEQSALVATYMRKIASTEPSDRGDGYAIWRQVQQPYDQLVAVVDEQHGHVTLALSLLSEGRPTYAMSGNGSSGRFSMIKGLLPGQQSCWFMGWSHKNDGRVDCLTLHSDEQSAAITVMDIEEDGTPRSIVGGVPQVGTCMLTGGPKESMLSALVLMGVGSERMCAIVPLGKNGQEIEQQVYWMEPGILAQCAMAHGKEGATAIAFYGGAGSLPISGLVDKNGDGIAEHLYGYDGTSGIRLDECAIDVAALFSAVRANQAVAAYAAHYLEEKWRMSQSLLKPQALLGMQLPNVVHLAP